MVFLWPLPEIKPQLLEMSAQHPPLRVCSFWCQMARAGVYQMQCLVLCSEGLEKTSSPGCVSGSHSGRVNVGLGSKRVLWEPKGLNDGIVVFEYL